jgi:hypothetical protein
VCGILRAQIQNGLKLPHWPVEKQRTNSSSTRMHRELDYPKEPHFHP